MICLMVTGLIVYGHKFVLLKSAKLSDILADIFFSTLISLNNVYYQTVGILMLPFQKMSWKPMKKDPMSTVSFKAVLARLWPTTLLGSLAIVYGCQSANAWLLISLPLLISFTLSIPVTYWSGQQRAR